MQINLSDITHSLELQTSIAGSVHYNVGYTDISASSVGNPVDNQGIIVTAVTTPIVVAPAVSTTRKIQHLTIYNNGVTNVITLKKDISGTEYIFMSVSLQNKESIRIINDKVSVLDASGRQKQQNIGDNEISGQSRSIFKVGSTMEAAGSFYFHGKDTGLPGAWSPGTPGVNGRNTDGTLAADAGCISVGNPLTGNWYVRDVSICTNFTGQFILCDFLWINTGLTVTTITAQAISQPVLPARDSIGSTNGENVQAAILVTTATTNVGAITNITLDYTNSGGVPSRIGTISSFPITAALGTIVKFQLQAGDRGIQSIQGITLGTSLVTGAISLILFNEIIAAGITVANVGALAYPRKLDVPIYNGHCLLPIWLASAITGTTINGNIFFINK